VIIEPLLREWAGVKTEIEAELAKRSATKFAGEKTKATNRAKSLKVGFLERLKRFRILDPACGSGNFLYLGLKALKDIEHRVNTDSEALGLARDFPGVGPENTLGIEINPFAAELARVSIWIGEIQWMREHGFDATRNPVLKSLDNIACHDALLNPDGTEYAWPAADAIVGNPPFLGAQRMISVMGEEYAARLRDCYDERVPRNADLVTFWLERCGRIIVEAPQTVFGLIATQSVRRGGSLEVLKVVAVSSRIMSAWADEPWVVDGAAVRVSIICCEAIDKAAPVDCMLDGRAVSRITPELTSEATGISGTERLPANSRVAFRCPEKNGPFELSGEAARKMLEAPVNPNGLKNANVMKRWITTTDLVGRDRDLWIVDFGGELTEADSELFEMPFHHIRTEVLPVRQKNRREHRAENWWVHGELARNFRAATSNMTRYIVTPRVSKHRVFRWVEPGVLPDSRLYAVARDDDCTLGILQARTHELWSLATCSWHGDGDDGGRPTYNATTCFETFPFPSGLSPNIPASGYASDPRAIAIAAAAKRLNDLRENWLNPADLVKRVPEVVAGYPDRILPIDDKAAAILKKRTLTNLYNERPAWLDHAHRDLDAAVAAAYGWTDWDAGTDRGLPDDVILERLFKLNQERAGK
jgi:type II restriction/modification system DNA methylase subunit YeeA